MQVWRAHEQKSETTYWFFKLKNSCWWRFDQQNRSWQEIKTDQSVSGSAISAIKPHHLSMVTNRELDERWNRMFSKTNPPFAKSDIAP